MRKKPLRTQTVAGAASLVLTGLLAVAGAAHAAQPTKVERRIAAAPGTKVRIVNVAGSVTVNGAAGSEVLVSGTLGASVERLDVVNENGAVLVKVVLPKRNNYQRDADAYLMITLPASSPLEISTVSADQTVRGVGATADLTTVSGDIDARLLGNDAQVKTVSGDMRLEGGGKPGKWRVSTVSGDLAFAKGAGAMEINTVSGDAQLQLEQIALFRGKTTSGDMSLRGRAMPGAEIGFESVSGDLNVAAGSDSGMDIDASSFSGDIRTCFGAAGEPVSEYSPGSKLATRRGDGGVKVRAKSLSGDISICDRN
jgi:hypothetical protein